MALKENVLTRTDDFIKWFLPKIEKFRVRDREVMKNR